MTVARFWRETPRRYNLGGNRCSACSTVYFPPRAVCPTCQTHRQSLGKMEPFTLSGDGEVYSFSVVHEGAEGFEMQVPYVLALIKTPEGPLLTGQVVDITPADVHIGMRVHAAFRKLREDGRAGVIHYGYKFAPSRESGASEPTASPASQEALARAAARTART
ncbi:MAG: Zn-ribbon domain-containing OB-fold protein [Euryarchaeota archaeon]|nr:Zn-ribbon domain-containing OB-fold protein [Euryarchaeota archaeon]MDE1835751.1 Zn-ribbon domain-containing OB-fold protein [Euryarchaeota archaeon]MDE1882018.1 Zn-ribbon domain-containing OB-fold protein [Euryarchaeota archaeon]MDE2043942.1 Zn-ribbon domain-containing OB-fold protein [Thermoplasmata archaeon]